MTIEYLTKTPSRIFILKLVNARYTSTFELGAYHAKFRRGKSIAPITFYEFAIVQK